MRLPRPGWQLPVTVLLAGAVLLGRTVAGELVGDALASVRWVAGSVLALGGIAWLVRWRLRRRAGSAAAAEPAAARAGLPVPVPAAPELVGRGDLLAAAVAAARHSGVLVLHGPRGIGTSALARAVAHRLSAEGAYADLRPAGAGGPESPARSRSRVLAALGLLPPRAPTAAAAYEQVAQALRDTGRVLLVDNADTAEQLDWLVRPIPGAYVLAAGDVPPPAGRPELAVGPLGPEHGLELLRAAPAVADRARPGRAGVRRLAQAYLRNPAAVLALRSWLAANPQVPVAALVADLDGESDPGGPPSELLRTVFRLQTRGLSDRARELLALLPEVPLVVLSDAAVGALLRRSPAAGHAVAAELSRAGLLTAVSPARCEVPREARALGLPTPDGAPAALARLVAHYAGDAVEQLDVLTGPARSGRADREAAAEAWFRREHAALLALLERPGRVPRSAAPRLALIADALDAWYVRDGQPADRRAAAEAALAVAADLGDVEGELTARLRLAAAARTEGELDQATEHLRAARELGGVVGDPRLFTGLGQQALALGDVAGARQEFERNLSRRPRRDAVGRVIDQIDLGAAAVAQGDLDLAERRLHEADVLAQAAGDLAGVAYAQELLGLVAARRGESAAALDAWSTAQLLFEQRHDDQGQARCLLHRATLLAASEPATAQRMLRASLALRGQQTTGVGVALAHLQLAGHLAAGDPAAAAAHRAGALAALAPWEGRIDPPADVAALRRQLAEADRSPAEADRST